MYIKPNRGKSVRDWKFQLYEQASQSQNVIYSAVPINFQPMINLNQYRMLLEIWEKFTEICHHNNITYTLDGGSLLGSYKHHGLVPWDYDIDVIVSRDDVIKLQRIVTKEREYAMVHRTRAFKVFKLHENFVIQHAGFNWPFVDIFVPWQIQTHKGLWVILAYPTGISVNPTGARKCRLT